MWAASATEPVMPRRRRLQLLWLEAGAAVVAEVRAVLGNVAVESVVLPEWMAPIARAVAAAAGGTVKSGLKRPLCLQEK
jgi:hypothetical protein